MRLLYLFLSHATPISSPIFIYDVRSKILRSSTAHFDDSGAVRSRELRLRQHCSISIEVAAQPASGYEKTAQLHCSCCAHRWHRQNQSTALTEFMLNILSSGDAVPEFLPLVAIQWQDSAEGHPDIFENSDFIPNNTPPFAHTAYWTAICWPLFRYP